MIRETISCSSFREYRQNNAKFYGCGDLRSIPRKLLISNLTQSRPLTPVYQTRDYREGSASNQGRSHQQSRTSKGTMRPRRRNECGLQAKVYWCHRHRAACVRKQVLLHGTTAAARTCSLFRSTGTLSLHSWDQPDVPQHAARRYEPPADPHQSICFRSEVNLVTSTSDPPQPSQRGKRAAQRHLISPRQSSSN